jgi:hypothetical protein
MLLEPQRARRTRRSEGEYPSFFVAFVLFVVE